MPKIATVFQQLSTKAWCATKVPFRLAVGDGQDLCSILLPTLAPGWYSLSWSPVLTHNANWQGDPPDIEFRVNYDTEDSVGLSGQINTEMSHACYLSEARKLGPNLSLDGSMPSPCGTWVKSFHTTDGGGPFSLTLSLMGGSAGGTVEGWVHLLLKRED